MQQVNFVVFGVLTIVFAIGVDRAIMPDRAGWVGPLLLMLSGLGLILAAVFPLREDASGVTHDPGGHVVAGTMLFARSSLGLILLSRRLARDPRWRGLTRYTQPQGSSLSPASS